MHQFNPKIIFLSDRAHEIRNVLFSYSTDATYKICLRLAQ